MLLLGIHEHAERSFRPEQAIVDLLRDSNTKAVTLLKKEEEKVQNPSREVFRLSQAAAHPLHWPTTAGE